MKLLIKTKGGHEQGLGDITGSIALAGKAVERGIMTKIILEGEKPAIDLVKDSGFEWDEVKTSTDFFLLLDAFSPDAVLFNQLNSPIELIMEIKKRHILVATVDDTGPACRVVNAFLLTAAVFDMEAAYTNAAGQTPTDYLNTGSGELAGLTLAPGLYTFTTGVTISNDVTLSGSSSDVWIFQIPGTLDISSAYQS